MDAKKYTIRTFWSDEDEAFIATCPEFPGLSAFGDTRAKATKEAEIVLEEFIKITLEDGETLPTPGKMVTPPKDPVSQTKAFLTVSVMLLCMLSMILTKGEVGIGWAIVGLWVIWG